jgi:hypothetical protein
VLFRKLLGLQHLESQRQFFFTLHFNNHTGDVLVLNTDCVKFLGVMLESKLFFQQHVNYTPSQSLELLGLIRFITDKFSFLDNRKAFIML